MEERMKVRVICSLVTILGALLWTNLPGASAADFYDGKTLRFVVGSAPGGGYDTYTRMIAPYQPLYSAKPRYGGGEHGRGRWPDRR
jgi:tripartite-type tricarboxylate transporter receptor subunit TctC